MTFTIFDPPSYDALLETFGYDRIVQVDDQDYQGDTRVLFQDSRDRYGYLQFGWGSCSGCDALQACASDQDVDDLAASLKESIQWFDTAAECLQFFQTHDWAGDYSYHQDEQRQFIAESIAFLLTQTQETKESP